MYQRNCPSCENTLEYSSQRMLERAINRNTLCNSCAVGKRWAAKRRAMTVCIFGQEHNTTCLISCNGDTFYVYGRVPYSHRYTSDGHMIGDDGWIMPLTTKELFDRYQKEVERFLRYKTNDEEEVSDICQKMWLFLLSPTDRGSRFRAQDYVGYLNQKFAATLHQPPTLGLFLWFIKTVVREAVHTDYDLGSSKVLKNKVSLFYDDGDEKYVNQQFTPNYYPKLLLEEYLGYVEMRAPHLIDYIVSLENRNLSHRQTLDERDKYRQVQHLAEQFIGA